MWRNQARRRRLLQAVQIAEDLYEGILRGILRQMEISQQRPGITDRHILELSDQGRERRRIAFTGASDELGRWR